MHCKRSQFVNKLQTMQELGENKVNQHRIELILWSGLHTPQQQPMTQKQNKSPTKLNELAKFSGR